MLCCVVLCCVVSLMHSASDKNLVDVRFTNWRIVERRFAMSYCFG